MKRIPKLMQRVLCTALVSCLVSGSAAYAYADDAEVISAEQTAGTEVEIIPEQDDYDPGREYEISESREKNEEAAEHSATDIDEAEETAGPVEETAHSEEEAAAAQAELEQSALELGYVPGEILVVYNENVDDADIEETAEELEGTVTDVIDNGEETVAVVEISGETTVDTAVEEYEADPSVAYAEPNFVLVNMDGEAGAAASNEAGDEVGKTEMPEDHETALTLQNPGYDYLSAINATGKNGASKYIENWIAAGNTLRPVKVGIIDTGFDLSLLSGRYDGASSIKLSVTEASGDDTASSITSKALTQDELILSNHGTNVTGVLIETAEAAGLSLHDLVLVDAAVKSGGFYTVSSVAYAIDYLRTENVKVINMSLGTLADTESAVLSSCIRAAYNENVIMICAAGNGSGTRTVYPSDDPRTISVMAVNESGALWSESGSGSLKDIAAPGVNIKGIDGAVYSGTSLSAPMVTAAVALLKSVDSGVSQSKALNLLRSTAAARTSGGESYLVLNMGAAVKKATGGNNPGGKIDISKVNVDASAVATDSYYPDWTSELVLTYEGHMLENGVDYRIRDDSVVTSLAGNTITVSAVMEGKKHFSGTRTITVGNIAKRDIKDCTPSKVGTYVRYDDSQIRPEITLTYSYNGKSDLTLTEGDDYTVQYGTNNTIGEKKGTIIVTGAENSFYTGSAVIYFDIISPDSVVKQGKCGENATYVFYADGKLVISGEGSMRRDAFWGWQDIAEVVIGEGITEIGSWGFRDSKNITTVWIPRTVKKIGTEAFRTYVSTPAGVSAYTLDTHSKITNLYIQDPDSWGSIEFGDSKSNPFNDNCYTDSPLNVYDWNGNPVTEIHISEETEKINDYAFNYWNTLKKVVIPNRVTGIGKDAFRGCCSLESVNFPDGITGIGNYAFFGCSVLSGEMVLPDSVTNIGNYAFGKCKITQVEMKDNVTSIGDYAFFECSALKSIRLSENLTAVSNNMFWGCTSLSAIDIPSSVRSIGSRAFWGCSGLKVLQIPNGVQAIEKEAFKGSYLTKIYLPASIKHIGSDAFRNGNTEKPMQDYLASLSEVYIEDPNTWSAVRFDDYTATPVYTGNAALYDFQGKPIEEIAIPDGIQKIESYAYYNWKNLKKVTIPNTVTEIGRNAFTKCEALNSITISEYLRKIGQEAFIDCSGLTSVSIPGTVESIERGAFQRCRGITSIDFQNGLAKIGDYAFCFCEKLEKAVLPDSVTQIGEWAFYGCGSLKTITLSSNIEAIGSAAFARCDSLSKVYIDPSKWADIAFKDQSSTPFTNNNAKAYDLEGNLITEIVLLDGIEQINDYAFCYWSVLRHITLPDTVNRIGKYAFFECDNLSDIILSKNLKSIDERAFSECISLTNIIIPEGVECIEVSAFYGCSNIRNINIPNSVSQIGSGAFSSCSSLDSISLPSGLTTVADSLLSGCSSLKEISIPDSVTVITQYAFSDCSSLENITLPAGLIKFFGERIFYNCTSLKQIRIPQGIRAIERYTFYGCSSLETVELPNALTDIGEYAFYGCTSLTDIEIPESIGSIGINAFKDCRKLSEAVFPMTEFTVGKEAFKNNNLTHVVLPTTTNITADNYTNYFDDSVNVQLVSLPDDKIYGECGDYADWSMDPEGNLVISGTGAVDAYYGSESVSVWDEYYPLIKSVTIQKGITAINDGSFSKFKSLTEVVLPETLEKIGDNAFNDCTKLLEVSIPKKVTSIGSSAFYSCMGLKKVNLPSDSELTGIQPDTFGWCVDLETINIGNAHNLQTIGAAAFYNCVSLQSVDIPSSVTVVGNYAFFNCSAVERVDIPYFGSVKTIGKAAFALCSNLNTISFSQSLKSLGTQAFLECENLSAADMYRTEVKDIGEYTFYKCSALASLSLPQNLSSIGNYAFYDCDSLVYINIPAETVSVGRFAFAGQDNLISAYFNRTDTAIGNYAFYNDAKLCKVTMPGELSSLPEGAFAFCDALEEISISDQTSIGKNAFAKRDDYYGFQDDESIEANYVSIAEGEDYTLSDTGDANTELCISCDVIVSLNEHVSGNHIIHANAPGIATVLYKTGEGVMQRWFIDVQTPIDADPDNVYKQPGNKHTFQHEHKYLRYVITAATCGTPGLDRYRCSKCLGYYDVSTPATGNHDIWTETIGPTCVNAGWTRRGCTRCNFYEEFELPPAGHSPVTIPAKAATCTEAGLTEGVQCSVCGMILNAQRETSPTRHSFKTTVKRATQKANGCIIRACKKCGFEVKRTPIKKIKTFTLSKTAFIFNGNVQRPALRVKDSTGKKIPSKYYTVTFSNKKSKNAGSYKIKIKFKGIYSGTKKLTYKITKAGNPMMLKTHAKTYIQENLIKAESFNIGVSAAKGKVTYTPDEKAKDAGIKVTSKGKVTVPKECECGTYKINVSAAGNKNYARRTKTVIIKVEQTELQP